MAKLPKKFEHLQSLADEWSRPTQMQRLEKRLSSSFEDLRAFYDEAVLYLDEIAKHLETVSMDGLSGEDRALLDFSFAIAMVAPAIEFFGQPAVVCGFDSRKFLPLHEPTSDRPSMSIAEQSLV